MVCEWPFIILGDQMGLSYMSEAAASCRAAIYERQCPSIKVSPRGDLKGLTLGKTVI